MCYLNALIRVVESGQTHPIVLTIRTGEDIDAADYH